jgi:hypothetical protein
MSENETISEEQPKCILPRCPFRKYVGAREYLRVKILWDEDKDARILCWLECLDPEVLPVIDSAREHEGNLKIVLREPPPCIDDETWKSIVSERILDSSGGVSVCNDWWTVDIEVKGGGIYGNS